MQIDSTKKFAVFIKICAYDSVILSELSQGCQLPTLALEIMQADAKFFLKVLNVYSNLVLFSNFSIFLTLNQFELNFYMIFNYFQLFSRLVTQI